ncbi:MAG: hypothetical protein IK085_02595 [Clostridia bacterium]|nr:hypothetical protein [Clostridia bacterium]
MNKINGVIIEFAERSRETEIAMNQIASFLAEMIIKYGDEVLKEIEKESETVNR